MNGPVNRRQFFHAAALTGGGLALGQALPGWARSGHGGMGGDMAGDGF